MVVIRGHLHRQLATWRDQPVDVLEQGVVPVDPLQRRVRKHHIERLRCFEFDNAAAFEAQARALRMPHSSQASSLSYRYRAFRRRRCVRGARLSARPCRSQGRSRGPPGTAQQAPAGRRTACCVRRGTFRTGWDSRGSPSSGLPSRPRLSDRKPAQRRRKPFDQPARQMDASAATPLEASAAADAPGPMGSAVTTIGYQAICLSVDGRDGRRAKSLSSPATAPRGRRRQNRPPCLRDSSRA